MSRYIEHDGIIVSQVADNKFSVKIEQRSACATCHAAALCTAAESKDKIIEAYSTNSTTLRIGDKVVVYGRTTLGYKALILSIVLPFVISLLTLLIVSGQSQNELTGGIAALAILVPYYLILACFRRKIQREFVFYIKPKRQ